MTSKQELQVHQKREGEKKPENKTPARSFPEVPSASVRFEDHITPVTADLRRYAMGLTRNSADADDLLQETLTRAFRKFHLWEPGTNLVAWLVVIMRRLFLSNYVQGKHARHDIVPIEEWTGAAAPSQELTIQVREVEIAIMRLSRPHQQVLRTVAIGGAAYNEAARDLNVPVGTIRSRLGRARTQLKFALASERGTFTRRQEY